MIYQVEDTPTGFKLTVLVHQHRHVVREIEVPGSHSSLAKVYGVLERIHKSENTSTDLWAQIVGNA